MLEGTSPDLSVAGGPNDAVRPTASVRPKEPRKEIWFRRRVSLVSALRELWAFRELTATIAERDLRVRYKQAALGIAWAVIAPVAMTVAFTFVFHRFAKVNTGGAPPVLFYSLGLLPWTFFSGSLSNGGLSLVTNNALLNKLYCPREVFPIAAIIDSAFDAVIAVVVVLALLFPITGYAPKVQAYYLPLLLDRASHVHARRDARGIRRGRLRARSEPRAAVGDPVRAVRQPDRLPLQLDLALESVSADLLRRSTRSCR